MADIKGQVDVLVFDLRGKLAHFRQPDTTVTQATYPFPPRPTLHGLLGAILGIDYSTPKWNEFLCSRHYLGLRILSPVQTVCMQMSLLGKGFLGNGKDFNRPTVVEMVVEPKYRVYYAGEYFDLLNHRITNRRSVFHTYLGSAYCLTFPEFGGCYQASIIKPLIYENVEVSSVIPRDIVESVHLEDGLSYAVSRAMPYQHHGDRTFERTTSVLYEVNGKPLKISINPKTQTFLNYMIVELPSGERVCLW